LRVRIIESVPLRLAAHAASVDRPCLAEFRSSESANYRRVRTATAQIVERRRGGWEHTRPPNSRNAGHGFVLDRSAFRNRGGLPCPGVRRTARSCIRRAPLPVPRVFQPIRFRHPGGGRHLIRLCSITLDPAFAAWHYAGGWFRTVERTGLTCSKRQRAAHHRENKAGNFHCDSGASEWCSAK